MSTVVQFCIDLLTQRQSSDAAAATTTTTDADDADDDDDVLFLLATLCQLYLDVGAGKCSLYRINQLVHIYVFYVTFSFYLSVFSLLYMTSLCLFLSFYVCNSVSCLITVSSIFQQVTVTF